MKTTLLLCDYAQEVGGKLYVLGGGWSIYRGALCEQDGWGSIIHRSDRGDLSLFQLGLRLLDYLLNEDFTIPVAFYISI